MNTEILVTLGVVGTMFLFANKANAQANDRAIRLIKETESLSLTPYQDEGNVWHIGYGRKIDSPMDYNRITQAQAEQWLREDVGEARKAVNDLVKVQLEPNEKAALISLVYNIGRAAFAGSTLLRKLNRGDKKGAAEEFERWVYTAGKPSKGLRTRRMAEKQVFES